VCIVIATFVIWYMRGMETAATFAEAVSVISILGLAGTLSTRARPGPPVTALAEKPSPEMQGLKTKPASSSLRTQKRGYEHSTGAVWRLLAQFLKLSPVVQIIGITVAVSALVTSLYDLVTPHL
jgi:hypothetical protein